MSLNHAQAALSAKAPYQACLQDDGRAASPRPPLGQGKAAISACPQLNHAQAALSAKAPYQVLLQDDGRAASPRPPLGYGKAADT